MSEIRISALFSTYNRSNFMRKALDGLLHQTLPEDEFEVIVVDDGSSDNTQEVVEAFRSRLNLSYVFQKNSGLAAGKNAALRLAKAPIVLFMDDDDVPDVRLLEEHLASHTAYPQEHYAVLGYTALDNEVAALPLMHFVTEVGCFLFCYPRIKHGDVLDYTYFWGGRSSCKRNLLLQHGMFDPVFRFGCEDIELGYRLSRQGLRVIYNRKAISTMIRSVSLSEFCRRAERQGRSNWVFSRMHPTEEVLSWSLVRELESDWLRIGYRHEELMRIASGLDQIALVRQQYGFDLDEMLLKLLHRSYWDVIASFRIKGSYGASIE